MKRILALLLLLGTVFALCACPGGGPTGPGGELGNEPDPIDSIPTDEYNFKGDKLSISIRNDYEYEIYADATSQEGIDPEIYKRNAYTERRFNFKINPLLSNCQGESDANTHVNDVKDALLKGSFKFDVIFMWAWQSGKLVKGANYLDWRLKDTSGNYYLPYTGESLANKAEWWPAGINDASTVMGHQYIAVSDMSISSMESAYAIVYNYDMVNTKQIAQNLGYRDMYDIVEQGDWTLDLFYDIVKDGLYYDNPDYGVFGQKDDYDNYGFMYQRNTGIDAFINSLGFQCVKNDGENMPSLWNMNQTLITAAEDVRKLCLDGASIDKGDYEKDLQFFAEGHAYFATMKLASLRRATMHAMEDDYGILPYPKLNEAQQEYLTGSDDHCSVFSIPTRVKPTRYEIIGVAMEALSARTNQVVKKQFYETMLKTNSTRNLQDEEMIDTIIEGRVYDFVTYHHEDLWVDKDGIDGHLHAFFRYLVMQEPNLSPSDYWNRGKDILQGGTNVKGSLSELVNIYINMYNIGK